MVDDSREWFPAIEQAVAGSATVMFRDTPDSYVATIDDFDDHSFEVVSVDGSERPECCRRAMRKVKPGGLLVLDDSWRAQYDEAKRIVPWPRKDIIGLQPYVDVLGCTTIWTAP